MAVAAAQFGALEERKAFSIVNSPTVECFLNVVFELHIAVFGCMFGATSIAGRFEMAS